MHRVRIAPSASTASTIAALIAGECERDAPLLAMPRAEINVVVRFGPAAARGLDVHAFGVQQTVRRKVLRAGHRMVMARLRLGASEAVLGVPATALAGRIVALDELWGTAATRRLCDRLATAPTTIDAATIVERAIADRLAAIAAPRDDHPRLVLEAADRLGRASVGAVAVELGVSERHLRRVFRDAVGVSPKAFARLARFRRALHAAREATPASWARIATATGYYDQSHLIDEFRAIAGATPRALLGELADQAAAA